jgi:L-asparaginase II
MAAILAEQVRGPLVETLWRGEVALVDSAGALVASVGDPRKVTFWRSAAKPIQALPLLATGAADAFGYGEKHLAVAAASHNAEPVHVEAVREALHRAGLSADMLQCGPHYPIDRATARAMRAAGEKPTALHSNCSGKHTGMLALARHLGLRFDDYLEPDSAIQRLILRAVADAVAMPPEQIQLGIDGCGVPVFGMPLYHMALSFARLAEPEQMGEMAGAARQMREAMLNEPYLVAGRNRICTDLMSLPGRRFAAKSGAEGVYCVGILPEAVARSAVLQERGIRGGLGLAVKVEDGHEPARDLVVVETMEQLGLLAEEDRAPLQRYRPAPVTNYAGTEVGFFRPSFRLNFHP